MEGIPLSYDRNVQLESIVYRLGRLVPLSTPLEAEELPNKGGWTVHGLRERDAEGEKVYGRVRSLLWTILRMKGEPFFMPLPEGYLQTRGELSSSDALRIPETLFPHPQNLLLS